MQEYGKKKNRAQPYNTAEEESFWFSGLLGDHNGVALSNANFKNLSEHLGFRGRQDHYDAYVQDFEVMWIQLEGGEMAKCVRFNENPTKTRTGGLTVKHRKTPQEMWATDGGPKDPVILSESFSKGDLWKCEPLFLCGYRSSRHQGISPPTISPPRNHLATNH